MASCWWTLVLFMVMLNRFSVATGNVAAGALATTVVVVLILWLLLIRDITRHQERAIAQRDAQA